MRVSASRILCTLFSYNVLFEKIKKSIKKKMVLSSWTRGIYECVWLLGKVTVKERDSHDYSCILHIFLYKCSDFYQFLYKCWKLCWKQSTDIAPGYDQSLTHPSNDWTLLISRPVILSTSVFRLVPVIRSNITLLRDALYSLNLRFIQAVKPFTLVLSDISI